MSVKALTPPDAVNEKQVGYSVQPGYNQTEVGLIPNDWKVVSTASLAEASAPIRYGVVQVGQYVSNGVPIVAIKYVKEISWAPLHRTARNLESPYAGSRVQAGDVLISIKGTIGRVGVVPAGFEGNISRELARIRLNKNVSPEYFAQQLESGKTQDRIAQAVVGTTRLEFSIATLRNFLMPLPPTRAEQDAIADALGDADSLVESLERLIAKKRHLKQAVMQQLLTGKKRLPGFEVEWNEFTVADVIQRAFCGPSPTCEERNIRGDEWGVLKTTAITWKNGWDWTKHKTLPKSFWNQPNKEVSSGDVIVTKAGPRHRVGVAASVDFIPRRILASGKMIALRPIQSQAIGRMLAAAIASPKSQQYLNQRTTGMAEAQLNFENGDLLNTPITLPAMPEQIAIVSVLTEIEAEIKCVESKLIKARQIKQGMMQELLTGRTRLV